jgi:death on curing protein
MMRFLSVDNVILFHDKILKETGGSTGIRDRGLIESALNRGFMTYDGKDLYPGIIEKISVTAYSLICNHGFVDGNKRIGVAVMVIMLKMNNVKVNYTQKELINLGLRTAEGFMKEKDILNWINEHIGET